MRRGLCLILFLIIYFNNLSGEQSIPTTPEERYNNIIELDWKDARTHSLPSSHSTVTLPADHFIVIGADAKEFDRLNGNMTNAPLEAVICDGSLNNSIYFEYRNDGYVSTKDWKDIDANEFINAVSENTEKDNIERRKLGMSELHVKGWLKEPTLDKKTNTVYWAIEAQDRESLIVNSVALKLGRRGYEKVVLVTNKDSYSPIGGELDVMLQSHSFDEGYRYGDFTPGDQIATYGIATLVAATVGAKVLKSAGFALLLKKLGGFLAALGAAALFKFKSLFRREKQR